MKMLKTLVMMFAVATLATACADHTYHVVGQPGPQGPQGEPGPAPTPDPTTPEQAKINQMVQDENEYRLSLGQSVLSPGLSCSLQTFTSGDRIQASIAGHNTFAGLTTVATFLYSGQDSETTFQQYEASINDGLNLLPAPLRLTYLNMFLVRCQGQIVITQSGTYNVELYSDDGSLLYLDGSKVIDNDNNHGITRVAALKSLKKGVHTFRLDYAQSGGGSQALVLRMNGVSVPPRYFFH